jgi:phosphoserine phosphatase
MAFNYERKLGTVSESTINRILEDAKKHKKCQAFSEERGISPKECIYFGESEYSPQCTFCDGTPKKSLDNK